MCLKDLSKVALDSAAAWIEPVRLLSQVQRPNHYAAEPREKKRQKTSYTFEHRYLDVANTGELSFTSTTDTATEMSRKTERGWTATSSSMVQRSRGPGHAASRSSRTWPVLTRPSSSPTVSWPSRADDLEMLNCSRWLKPASPGTSCSRSPTRVPAGLSSRSWYSTASRDSTRVVVAVSNSDVRTTTDDVIASETREWNCAMYMRYTGVVELGVKMHNSENSCPKVYLHMHRTFRLDYNALVRENWFLNLLTSTMRDFFCSNDI